MILKRLGFLTFYLVSLSALAVCQVIIWDYVWQFMLYTLFFECGRVMHYFDVRVYVGRRLKDLETGSAHSATRRDELRRLKEKELG